MKENLLPHNAEAEEAVLGGILVDPDQLINVDLRPDDFYIRRHGWIFEAIKNLDARGAKPDIVTLSDELVRMGRLKEVGGAAALTGLINATPTSIHTAHYARIVHFKSVLRQQIQAATAITAYSYKPDPEDDAELVVAKNAATLAGASPARAGSIVSAEDILAGLLDDIATASLAGGVVGVPTGLTDLDSKLGGLQRSDLIIVAGRPGMGKTSLAMGIVDKVASRGGRCLVFSLEMSAKQLMLRLVSSRTGIETQKIKSGQLKKDSEEWLKVLSSANELAALPIHIDDTGAITASQLCNRARKHHMQHGVDLIVVDHLTLLGSDNQKLNFHQTISQHTKMIKSLAKEFNIPVVILAQLNRSVEQRADKRPMLSDLRESGAIEEDADVVLLLYRDDVYNPETELKNLAEIIIAKHRNGATGVVSAYFRKHLTQFVDLVVRTKKLDY